MPFDIERARRDTPAASQVLHFNNAGAALMPEPVLRAQLDHLQLEVKIGGYEAAAAEDDRPAAVARGEELPAPSATGQSLRSSRPDNDNA